MDTTQGVPMTHARRSAVAVVLSFGLCAILASSALAGPVDPTHRFERIGSGVADTSAILPMPGQMRALVLVRTGELRLVCGDGLVDAPLATVDVRSECPEKGLLSGVWAPGQEGRELYVTYVSDATGFFTVGKMTFDERLVPSDVEVIWQALSPAPCDNLGGAIAFASDGTLLVGTGDFGNPAGAGQLTSPVGKILRFTAEGFPPQAPLEPNPFGASPTYAMGCRNPVRLTVDSATGDAWFLDLGPGDNDEINLVAVQTNYGWNNTMLMGRNELPGDPHHVWSPAVGPSGLNLYRAEHFKNAGRIMVAANDGLITEVSVDTLAPANSTENVLFTPEPDGPQDFRDLTVLPDGMVYVVDASGDLFRLTNSRAQPVEPSNGSSIVPLLINKLDADTMEFAIEREGVAGEFGLYVGDLMLLAGTGFNHGTDENGDGEPNETQDFRLVDLNDGDAWSRFQVGVDELSPDRAPASEVNGRKGTYFLLSSVSSALETPVGYTSFDFQRPGGDQFFTCEDGCASYGIADGECMQDTNLDIVMQDPEGDGSPVNLGSMEATVVGDCKVTLLLLGAEWCPPCQAEAPHVQGLVDTYGADRLAVISVLHQNSSSGPADQATAERWIAAYGLTYKVVADPSASVISTWSGCGGIPQSYLFDEQGKQVNFFCGYNPSGLDAAIETEMNN